MAGIATGGNEGDGATEISVRIGSYLADVQLLDDAAGSIFLLWAIRQPTLVKPNFFVSQSSTDLRLDACGHQITISQTPSSMSVPGVTGAVMWDSGIVLAKFLESAVDSGRLVLQGNRVVELGSGCGLVGCVAALLGARVVLTDLPDRLKLLKKNVEANATGQHEHGSAQVCELTWGEDVDPDLTNPPPDFVVGSDVVYSESAVVDLISTLKQLSGRFTTIFLAGELRNAAVLEYFLEMAMEEFVIGTVDQTQWHPDYISHRVAIFVMVKKLHHPEAGLLDKRTHGIGG
ncbi:S-adenosyl-L-methionine-dependent methyltransferases superfamily protein [Wolffia australiana]